MADRFLTTGQSGGELLGLINSDTVDAALATVRELVDYAKLKESLNSRLLSIRAQYEALAHSQQNDLVDRAVQRAFAEETTRALIAAKEYDHAYRFFKEFMDNSPNFTRTLANAIISQDNKL